MVIGTAAAQEVRIPVVSGQAIFVPLIALQLCPVYVEVDEWRLDTSTSVRHNVMFRFANLRQDVRYKVAKEPQDLGCTRDYKCVGGLLVPTPRL